MSTPGSAKRSAIEGTPPNEQAALTVRCLVVTEWRPNRSRPDRQDQRLEATAPVLTLRTR